MIVIIGAGISGLTAANLLRQEVLLLEQSAEPGGLAGQYCSAGFWFDYGGHYFHFAGKEPALEFVAGFSRFRQYRRNSRVFLGQHFIPYPIQFHLARFPSSDRKTIMLQMLERDEQVKPANLAEHLRHSFGSHLYGLFFRPFLEKFYRWPLTRLLADKDQGTIPVPDRSQLLSGLRGEDFSHLGYNAQFFYPHPSLRHFVHALAEPVRSCIRFADKVQEVDWQRKLVRSESGEYHYDRLISTMPLCDLVSMLRPRTDWSRIKGLRHVSTLVANVALRRRIRRFHWLYLPEERFAFYRIGYYPRQSHVLAYLEKTVTAAESETSRYWLPEVRTVLQQTGMIEQPGDILHADFRVIPVSYVLFDRNWPEIVPPLMARLRAQGIHVIGRYGCWRYSAMSDDILTAMATAAELNGE